ncbi:mediator of RNA polymerase II transcription subunit 25 [Hetaerina americana]|uniref:mediator of RNA polymerase II transcription subunit 25 n=1 Tax=Hetaerina americana TaxID=62018 RepID=UPI003A7F312B
MVIANFDHSLQADIVFAIEGTAINGAYLNDIKTNYLIPTIEYFSQSSVEEREYIAENNNINYAIVTYYAADCLPSPSSDCYGPYTSPQKLLSVLDKMEMVGGKTESHANVAEGLATALQCFDDLKPRYSIEQASSNGGASASPGTLSAITSPQSLQLVQKHCILICNSPPYNLPVMESFSYAGHTAEQLAVLLQERGINLSIMSPRKIPALFKLFDKAGGDLQASQTKNYTKDPRHLVLLKGFSLKERPISPAPGIGHQNVNVPSLASPLPSTGSPAASQAATTGPPPTAVVSASANSMMNQAPVYRSPGQNSPLSQNSGMAVGRQTQPPQSSQQTQQQPPPHVGGSVGSFPPQTTSGTSYGVRITEGANAQVMVSPHRLPSPLVVGSPQLPVAAPGSEMHGRGTGGPPRWQMTPNPAAVAAAAVAAAAAGQQNQQQQNLTGNMNVAIPGNNMLSQPMGAGSGASGTPVNAPSGMVQYIRASTQGSPLIAQLTQPSSTSNVSPMGSNIGSQFTNQRIEGTTMVVPQNHQQVGISHGQQMRLGMGQNQVNLIPQGTPGSGGTGIAAGGNTGGGSAAPGNGPVTAANSHTQQQQPQGGQGGGVQPTGTSQPAVRERHTIWQGILEWIEKPKNASDATQKLTRHVPCQVSANTKDGEPELKADAWPQKLIMQLMPKQLIGNIGGAYLKNSKSVLFHPQNCEALESLTKVMSSGFAGCVHFTSVPSPAACDIKVLILLYTSEKRAYLGFIPNDQAAFVDRLRKVIQHQKSTQAMIRQGQVGGGVSGGSGTGNIPGQSGAPSTMPLPVSNSNPMASVSVAGVSQQQQQQGMILPQQQQTQQSGMALGASGQISQGNVGQGQQIQPPQNADGHVATGSLQGNVNPTSIGGATSNPGAGGPGNNGPMRGQASGMPVGGSGGNVSGGNNAGTAVRQQQQQQQQQQQNTQQPPQPFIHIEAARQQNLMKIQQLRQTLEAAQQRELQYKSQLEIISHMKIQQLQQNLEVAQQQEMQYKAQLEQEQQKQLRVQLQQIHQQQQRQMTPQVMNNLGPQPMQQQQQQQQQRLLRPVLSNNPGLRHLLQQQPQYRQVLSMQNLAGGPQSQMGGGAGGNNGGNNSSNQPQIQTQGPGPQQFDDVPTFDFLN